MKQNDSDSKGSFMPNKINAFQLIGMSSCLDLSGLFEKDVSKFTKTEMTFCFCNMLVSRIFINMYI